MIIYNKKWLSNLSIQQQADDVFKIECINQEEVKAIRDNYPVGFYMPALLIRVGLFLLTCIVVLFSTGLLSLLMISSNIVNSAGWVLFLGVATYVVLEYLVKQKHYYHSGVDNALLYMVNGFIASAFIWMFNSLDPDYTHTHYLAISIVLFLMSLYLTLRFADLLMSLTAALSLLALILYGWASLGEFGITTLPFIMMLVSMLIIMLSRYLYLQDNTPQYYKSCLIVANVAGWVVLYLAGNFSVVHNLRNQFNNNFDVEHPMPLGWLFWSWTSLLPIVYIILGLMKKNVILLRLGVVLIAGSFFTFRYYYHIFAPEIELTIAGIILLAVDYLLIKYLKVPRHGFTYAADPGAGDIDKIKMESLLTGRTFGHASNAPATGQGSRFGGGSFGGGGSSSKY